ncbi:MAG: glycine/sarcosine/betaine reductase selenoprotein B family protein, partial [Candidatus Entotheonellia bacterium]
MSRPIRVVQFVNQFYAQVGGEEKAGLAPQLVDGAAGAARATAQILGSE